MAGSSPRVRGTAVNVARNIFYYRFIPAHAGNGRAKSNRRTRCTVHPRACGEREKNRVMRAFYDGSSPRVRGTVPSGLLDS